MDILRLMPLLLLVCGIHTDFTDACNENERRCADGTCVNEKRFCGINEVNCTDPCVTKSQNQSRVSTFSKQRTSHAYKRKIRTDPGKCAENEIMCIDGRCLDSKLFCVKEFGDVNCTVPCLPKSAVCSYGPWGKCSASCRQQRFRSCYDATGKKPKDVEHRKCHRLECQLSDVIEEQVNEIGVRVNGSWSEWSPWSSCSKTCGIGRHIRRRECDNPPSAFGGEYCQGPHKDHGQCEVVKCPINGEWSEWGEWGNCTQSGKKIRLRRCDNPAPEHGGNTCEGWPTEHAKCVICAESLDMALTPSRKHKRLGKSMKFTCSVCTSGFGLLTITMDTVPNTIMNGSTFSQNITNKDSCMKHRWTITPNFTHEMLICKVTNEEEFVIGTLVTKLKMEHRKYP